MRNYDERRVCFITCVNDERVYEEACLYLRQLQLPAGMELQLLPVRGAASMCAGYNQAMRQSSARYKVYLHQDVFLTQRDFIRRMLALFAADAGIGMMGLTGCQALPATGVWWGAERRYGKVYHAYEPESLELMDFGPVPSPFCEAAAIDGLLMATQYDLPWREEVFTGWHFYDISQSQEFWRQGLRVVIPEQAEAWCVHACGEKDLGADYWQYRDAFFDLYGSRRKT